jgi:hypothetical protein
VTKFSLLLSTISVVVSQHNLYVVIKMCQILNKVSLEVHENLEPHWLRGTRYLFCPDTHGSIGRNCLLMFLSAVSVFNHVMFGVLSEVLLTKQ